MAEIPTALLSRLPSKNGGFNYVLSNGVPVVKKKKKLLKDDRKERKLI